MGEGNKATAAKARPQAMAIELVEVVVGLLLDSCGKKMPPSPYDDRKKDD